MKIKKEITRGLGAVSACLLTVVSIGTPVAEALSLIHILGVDYRIHGADEFILVSEMEEAVEVYMEAIKNLLAI